MVDDFRFGPEATWKLEGGRDGTAWCVIEATSGPPVSFRCAEVASIAATAVPKGWLVTVALRGGVGAVQLVRATEGEAVAFQRSVRTEELHVQDPNTGVEHLCTYLLQTWQRRCQRELAVVTELRLVSYYRRRLEAVNAELARRGEA